MFYTLFSFSKWCPSPQPHLNFVSLNAKKTLKSLTLMSLKVWKKNSRKKNKKNQKKTKRKNLTPSSSKTIFHTLITLKDIFLAHHVNHSKKLFKNKVVFNFKKNSKKIKISKKKSVFILWTNPKLEFIYRKFFLHLTIDNFLMCV